MMQYLTKFNQFIKENNEDKSPGEKLQFQLREFNIKKNSLKNLIMSNIDTGKDISDNYKAILKTGWKESGDNNQNEEPNPFLQQYGMILKLESEIIKKEEKIKNTEESIKNLKNEIDLVNKLSDEEEKKEKLNNIEEIKKEKISDIEKDKKSIGELKNDIKEQEIKLSNFVKTKENELKNIQNNSF
jgi:hypothetical protein